MGHYVDKKTCTYSLGIRQRLCFAMQIVSNTPVMLMDEVMNGLDPNHVEMISKILVQKKARREVYHNCIHLEKYADRIFLMKDGLLLNVNDISPGFQTNEMTSVRVRNMPEDKQGKFKQTFYNAPLKAICDGVVIIDIPKVNDELLTVFYYSWKMKG